MTSKERFILALDRKMPDRLPVTTHHVQPYFLNKYLPGKDNLDFFHQFGLDPIVWITPETRTPEQIENWRITEEELPNPQYLTKRYTIHTPGGDLSCVLQFNAYTCWLTEHLIKQKKDIELLAKYMPAPRCDVDAVNRAADENPDCLIRGTVFGGDIFGQPGCWQQAACLYGIEPLIMESFDDPEWVHELLAILQKVKVEYIRSTKGARYDVLELGGGDASSTVISPAIFNEFVAPYDAKIIEEAHKAGQRIVYHTCGGMMPILEDIVATGTDAIETLTPPGMGADVDLAEAKRRVGDKVCMIGGFDQLHFFQDCTPEETRREVRRCFEAAGGNGGFILSPSDHFFDADLALIEAFADEARKCVY